MTANDSSFTERKDEALRRVRDEELMRRFLVSDVSEAERELVERFVAEDREYFEELCALESDMITAYLQGRLPREWRARFEESVRASPARRRQIEEQRAIRFALETIEFRHAGDERSASTASAPKSRWPARLLGLAAAAVLLVAVAGLAVYRMTPRLNRAPDQSAPQRASATTFFLAANQTRGPGQAGNIFRAPHPATIVRLQMLVVADVLTAPEVTLRTVGGPVLDGPAVPDVEAASGGAVSVSRSIDGGRLPPGDYLLTLTATSARGERADIASRFLSIE
jgi:hypothetical protein